MKGLSILFILNGLSIFIQSIINVIEDKNGRFITLNFDPQLYIIGIIVGFFFIIAGFGMWFRKKYAYYLSVSLCSLMSLYIFVSAILLIIQKSFGILVIVAIPLLVYLLVGRFIQKNKICFDKD